MPTKEFAPLGGMNQDDSLITPAKNNAGKSLFSQGDYRYALNARIGSSRNGNEGDLENILGTLKVTNYYVYSQIFSNPGFTFTLNPWQQLDDGPGYTAWGLLTLGVATYARVSITAAGAFTSRVLYQTGLTLNSAQQVIVKIAQMLVSITTGTYTASFKVVFLNGTTILKEETLEFKDLLSRAVSGQFDIPANCNGLGIRLTGTKTGVGTLSLAVNTANAYTFAAGAIPAGQNKTIGRLEDTESNRTYFCNYNSGSLHTVCFYDHGTQSVYELLRHSILGFSFPSFVSMAKLDNWMAMTDRVNGPRLINVNTISQTYLTLTSNFREFHLSFHKWSPIAPPIPRVYYDGTNNNYQRLKNKIYHFAFRIVYNGKLKSRYSPVSKGAITTKSGQVYSTAGALIDKTITSIQIEIPIMMIDSPSSDVEYNFFGYDNIKFTEAVESIEIIYRDGELELWKKWKTVRTTDFEQFYYFDGLNMDDTPVPDVDFIQPYDAVPFLAGTVEAIDNRFVFGDILDEREPVEKLDIQSVSVVKDPPASFPWNSSVKTPSGGAYTQFDSTTRDLLLRLNALSDFTYKTRGTYKVGVRFFDRTGWRSLVYTNEQWRFDVNFNTAFDAYGISAFRFVFGDSFRPPIWAVAFEIVRTNCINIDSFIYGSVNRFIPLIDDPAVITNILNVPQNVKDKITEYMTNSRVVNGSDISDPESAVGKDLDEAVTIELLKHQHKQRKKSRKFLHKKRKYRDFQKETRYSIDMAAQIRQTISHTLIASASRICIDIDNWYNAAKNGSASNQRLNKLYYEFPEGSRVRFTGSYVANPLTSEDYVICDVPVLEFNGRTIIIEKPEGLQWVAQNGSATANHMSIEVYTPSIPDQTDHVFYECGEVYPVLHPFTENRDFAKRNWNYSSNAEVTVSTYGPFRVFHKMPFFYGDVSDVDKLAYRTNVAPMTGVSATTIPMMMSPDPDKAYDYWDHNNGRATIAYDDLPVSRFKLSTVRFGQKIIEESSINQVNVFRLSDSINYPSEYGRIRSLVNTDNAQVESVGSILLVIGERKAWSVYVNRTTLEDLSGSTQVIQSTKVLGSYNTLLGDGTLNPESICKHRGNVYWWSGLSGVWNRYGRDGITEISKYKMKSWFKGIADLLMSAYLTDTPPRVISGYDAFNDELYTYIEHPSLPDYFRDYDHYKGMVFNEVDNQWKTAHNLAPEMFSKIGQQMILFLNGEVYLHEKGTNYSTFFGTKYHVYVEPVFNDVAVMDWQTLAVMATHGWSAEWIVSEFRGSARNPIRSEIPLASWVEQEDTFKAAIKRDMFTPNVVSPIINGRPVKSKAIRVLLRLDPSVVTLSLLHYAFAGYEDSPRNP